MDELVVPVEGLVVQMELTDPPAPAAPTRRPLSKLLVALVVLALLAVGAGYALARRAADERRAAIAARERVDALVADQRTRNTATDAQVAEDRAHVKTYVAATDTPLATAQQLDQMLGQELPTLQILQDAGKAARISSYNAAARTANANLDAYDAADTQFYDQIEKLPSP